MENDSWVNKYYYFYVFWISELRFLGDLLLEIFFLTLYMQLSIYIGFVQVLVAQATLWWQLICLWAYSG